MSEKAYTVFYNAIMTEHGSHVIAVGWCKAGWKPSLVRDEETSNFHFTLKKLDGDIAGPVISPFNLTAEIPDPPRSIFVKDDYDRYQVQVNGIGVGGSGENTSGKWVESVMR